MCLDNLTPFRDGLDHWLLAVNVFLRCQGIFGDRRVPMVGCRDDDRVYVRASQHLTIISRCENARAVDFFDAR